MGEFLPLLFGVLVGTAVSRIPRRLGVVLFPVLCIAMGALASAINGELAREGWALFVSFDSLLVWGAATCALGVPFTVRRLTRGV